MFLKINKIESGDQEAFEYVTQCSNCGYVEGNVAPANDKALFNGLLQFNGWMLTIESEADLSDPDRIGHICPKCSKTIQEKRNNG